MGPESFAKQSDPRLVPRLGPQKEYFAVYYLENEAILSSSLLTNIMHGTLLVNKR